MLRLMPLRLARQMVRPRPTCRFRRKNQDGRGFGSRLILGRTCVLGGARLQRFQPQLQLLDLLRQLLRLASKLHAPQLGGCSRFRSGSVAANMCTVSHEPWRCHLLRAQERVQKHLVRSTDNCGSQVRSGRRLSMPSSIDNCARVSATVPLAEHLVGVDPVRPHHFRHRRSFHQCLVDNLPLLPHRPALPLGCSKRLAPEESVTCVEVSISVPSEHDLWCPHRDDDFLSHRCPGAVTAGRVLNQCGCRAVGCSCTFLQ